MFTNEDISRYYDLSEIHYNFYWDLRKSNSLHYGYWDEHTKTFREALMNINRVLAGMAGITPGDRVLDAGCGTGGSAVWLADHLNCDVTGISLNAKQVSRAKELAAANGVSDKAHFDQQDYLHTTFPDQSFDIIWAIESVCYANDKSEFVREAYRLLKKGGRLIIADFFKRDNLQGRDAAAVKRWANGWAINDYATSEEFSDHLSNACFTNIQVVDASHAIMPSAKRLYRSYFIGIVASKLYRIFKGKPTGLARNNVDTAYLQYKTLRRGLWKYDLVLAEKR